MKIYYKVVTKSLQSAYSGVPMDLVTQYKVGEFVSSPYPETPLCVFERLHNAQSFMGFNHHIYECHIKTKLKTPWIPRSISINKLLKLIKLKKKYMDRVWKVLPIGTVCCKQVKLLKKIY